MTAEWILTDKELSEVLASQGNWKDDIYKVRDAQAKKLLEYLIRKTVLGTGWIGTKEFESMLKQLEAK